MKNDENISLFNKIKNFFKLILSKIYRFCRFGGSEPEDTLSSSKPAKEENLGSTGKIEVKSQKMEVSPKDDLLSEDEKKEPRLLNSKGDTLNNSTGSTVSILQSGEGSESTDPPQGIPQTEIYSPSIEKTQISETEQQVQVA